MNYIPAHKKNTPHPYLIPAFEFIGAVGILAGSKEIFENKIYNRGDEQEEQQEKGRFNNFKYNGNDQRSQEKRDYQ